MRKKQQADASNTTYSKMEVQKLLERCFALGIEAGRNEFFVSDYCTSEEQENQVVDALHKELLQFYKDTNFRIGF